ncbi:MAG: hypothetical protein ACRD9L_04970 [Bryobacteraceae bacterium]
MRYWGYLAGKVAVVFAISEGVRWMIGNAYAFLTVQPELRQEPFTHDLTYTFVMLLYSLFCAGLLYAVVWDQRYRCRTCLRRLRMPIERGSWTHLLLSPPRTEYICPYGHGTLNVPEVQITGRQEPDWQPHEDIWTELCHLEETKK